MRVRACVRSFVRSKSSTIRKGRRNAPQLLTIRLRGSPLATRRVTTTNIDSRNTPQYHNHSHYFPDCRPKNVTLEAAEIRAHDTPSLGYTPLFTPQ